MTKQEIKQAYEELMMLAHNIEDALGYDESPKGREFGNIVTDLQNFKL